MKKLRLIHLYLGCFFAPLLLYFSLSGTWQVFRFNDIPRDPEQNSKQKVEVSQIEVLNDVGGVKREIHSDWHTILNELSKPHKDSTAPGADPDKRHSVSFDWIAAAMGLGLFSTTLLGVVLALQAPKRRRNVWITLLAGLILPVIFLYL